MSEYQYLEFRAVDGPVSDKNLAFMQRQSSRAEITPWSFTNEYHYGDFHGDPADMLRRGYDFHLHYANFGTRTLMIRLPAGLPNPSVAGRYFREEGLSFLKEKQRPGVILYCEPCYEADALEEIGEVEECMDRLVPLRGELLDGDLRPLYLMHLAIVSDCNHDPHEEKEGLVPAGLGNLTPAQQALAEWYGLSEALIAAAARDAPALPEGADADRAFTAWLERLSADRRLVGRSPRRAGRRPPGRAARGAGAQADEGAPDVEDARQRAAPAGVREEAGRRAGPGKALLSRGL